MAVLSMHIFRAKIQPLSVNPGNLKSLGETDGTNAYK